MTKRIIIRSLTLLVAVMMMGGCASVFNPYKSSFQCPNTYKGKCTSVENAYNESVTGKKAPSICPDCDKKEKERESKAPIRPTLKPLEKLETAKEIYQASLYNKMTALIDNDPSPIVVPPKVMRVLILSYTGEKNEMFGYRYVYLFVSKPRWILAPLRDQGE
jgi:conjugal transfer pilus assembly protein TraV